MYVCIDGWMEIHIRAQLPTHGKTEPSDRNPYHKVLKADSLGVLLHELVHNVALIYLLSPQKSKVNALGLYCME
jgi:hypothetical protein